jgi:uncharacterized integral membrane protein
MRLLKPAGSYLKRKVFESLMLVLLFLVPFFVLFITSIDILPFYIDFGRYETPRGIFLVLFFMMGLFSIRRFQVYRKGLKGEEAVAKILSESLNDEYSLLNDVTLTNMKNSDIDHIVIGPTGVFAIETKNYRGKISYYGDDWEGVHGKPSVQARINAVKIHGFLEDSPTFTPSQKFVEGLVVFSDSQAVLIEKKPPDRVKVLRINSLTDYIVNKPKKFSAQEIESIEQTIKKNIASIDTD